MRGELIETLDRIGPLEEKWRELAVLRGNAFLTPEWYRAWWEDSDGRTPLIAVARRTSEELAGVMPLVLDRSSRPRAVRFGGHGFGDRFGIAARPEDEGAVAAAAMPALEGALPALPILVLHRIDLEGEWPASMARASSRRLAIVEQSRTEEPHVSVKDLDWEGYLAERSQKFRQRIGRGLERALERDGISYSVRVTTDPEAVAADMETLFRLHDLRHPGSESSIGDAAVRGALTRFAEAALVRNWLRLRVLEIEGRPAAAALAWRIGGSYALYQGGFDPAFADRSAGLLMLNLTVRSAIEEGADEVDLLLGGESYKWRFAPKPRRVHTLVVVRVGSPARWVASAEAAARRYGRWTTRRRHIGPIARKLASRLPSNRRT